MADIIELVGSEPTNVNIEKVQTNVKAVNAETIENKTYIDTVSADMGQITDKGYVNAKVVTNLNDALENGKYKIIISGHSIIANGTYLVDTTKYDSTASSQILRSVNVSGVDATYIRLYRAGVETARLIATTEKIDISSTLVNGWVIADNTPLTLTVSGKIANVTGRIKDGSRVKGTTIFTLPAGIRPSQYMLKKIYSHVASPVITGLFRLDTNVSDIRIDNNYDLAVATTHIIDITFPII